MTDKTIPVATDTTPKKDHGTQIRFDTKTANRFKLSVGERTNSEFLNHLLDGATGGDLFNEKTRAQVQAAADKLGVTFEYILIAGALKYALQAINTDDEKILSSTDMKIRTFVEDLMKKNEKAKNWYEKIEITQGLIAKELKSNRENIKRYIAANEKTLADHHAKCEIEPDHNRKVYNYNLKNKA